jgi:hypothetical protein
VSIGGVSTNGLAEKLPTKPSCNRFDHAIAAFMTQRSRLLLSFSPNPVYRNHQSDTKWYFDVYLHEMNGVGATLQHLRAQWIGEQGHVQDEMEEAVNIVIRPREQALFPELWVSSALTRFIYRLQLTGRDETGHTVRVESDLACW